MESRFNQPLLFEVTISGATVSRVAELVREVLHGDRQASANVHGRSAKPDSDEDLMLDSRQTAKLLRVCEKTAIIMSKNGKMPKAIRFGRAVRWSRMEIEAWINAGCPSMDSWTYQPKQKSV